MAIQTADLLSPLSQLHPFRMDMGGGGGDSEMERQRLKLLREQFEETKRRNQEDERIRRLVEEQAKVREQMITDRQAAKAKAEAEAALLGKKQEALQKFSEANGKGDIEGARTMVPYMSSLGMVVDLEGETNGLPRYRIYMSPEEKSQAERQQGLGYPEDDSGRMAPPTAEMLGGEISTEAEREALTSDPANPRIASPTEPYFRRALAAMPGLAAADSGKVTSEATESPVDLNQPTLESGATEFQAARPPDEPDYTGAVPKNVIDLSAIRAQTLSRLNPYLAGQIGAYPQAYQESATSTARGIQGLGLPLLESIKQFQDSRRSPDSLIQADIAAQAQAGNQQATREAAKLQQSQERYNSGFNATDRIGKTFNVKDIWERRRSTALAAEVLGNKDATDDYLAGATISRMMGERGATTEQDVERALGNAAPAFLDRIKNRLYHEAVGGLSTPQKNALAGVLRKSQGADAQRAHDFLDNVDEQLASPSNDEDYKRGMRAARDMLIPRDLREAHGAAKKKREQASKPPEETKPFNMEEDSRRQEGRPSPLAAEFPETTIPETSRIAFAHNNPGNLMFDDQEGASQGEPKKGGGHWAKFESVEAGLNALRQKILQAGEDGETVRSFITKYAPPTDGNDTEAYIAEAARELKVSPDDALAETDPYEVMRFVARKESSTVLPDQYAKPGEADATNDEDRIRAALQRVGR